MSTASHVAELILDAVTAHGGSISGAELRAELEGVEPADRRYAINKLRAEGRLTSTGATTTIRYYAGSNGDDGANAVPTTAPERMASSNDSTPGAPVRDQFELAEQIAADCVAGRTKEEPSGDTVWLTLPAINSDKVRLMAGLDQLVDLLSRHTRLDLAARARATAWLASKHQVAPSC